MSLLDKAKKYGYGDPTAMYYSRESEKLKEAERKAQASPEELALMAEQVKAVQQAAADRVATRELILGQLGFKLGTDADGKKIIVPLTNEERLNLMSKSDKFRTEAATAYQGRAKAAATGTTKLPSFLKKDIDYQKVKEEALLEELLGPDALKSTAGKQAIEAMKKKEEAVRQQIQEQDLAMAPGAGMNLTGQMLEKRGRTIAGYESLPNQQAGLIAGRGSLLQQMQQTRLDEYKRRLGELEAKRAGITNFYTLGGTVGGAAASAAASRKYQPNIEEKNYGTTLSPAPTYNPDIDTSQPYYINGRYFDATY